MSCHLVAICQKEIDRPPVFSCISETFDFTLTATAAQCTVLIKITYHVRTF